MNIFLKTLAKLLITPLIAMMGYAGYTVNPVIPVQAPLIQSQAFGASNVIDTPIALFSTSLASPITAASNSMTLVSGLTGDGSTLASSTYSFIIDEGQSDQEFVRADCTNTACTNMARGLSMIDGSTTIASLAQPHRRGQSVKITDAPLLLVVTNIINGNNGFPNIVSYSGSVATTSFSTAQQIIDKGYVDYLAFNGAGVINATTGARGISQLATGLQAASSTSLGSTGASVVLNGAISTSTYNSATAALKVVVTQNNGRLDPNFISSIAPSFSTSTSIGSFAAWQIGKQGQIFTSTGTSTFTVPSGITLLRVRVIGAGGSGGSGDGSHTNAAGGGAGAFAEKFVDVTGTTSIQVFVGTTGNASSGGAPGNAGTWSTFGTNGYYISSNGGLGGAAASASATSGGAGGTASTTNTTGADITITGGSGSGGTTAYGGRGGDNPMGFGGPSRAATGSTGTGYGAGGSGDGTTGGGGAVGTNGAVLINW